MRRGTTLVEVLAVLALAGMLIYGAWTAMMTTAPKYRLKKAVWEIQTRLNYARYRAIFEGSPFRVRFAPGGYAVEKYDASGHRWLPKIAGMLEGVKIDANNNPTFYPLGTVSNLATILVSNSWGGYRVTIAISGRVKAIPL